MGQMKLIFLFLILSIKKCTALQIWTLMCLLRYIQNWLIKIYAICSSKFEKSLTKKEGKVHTDQLKLQKEFILKKDGCKTDCGWNLRNNIWAKKNFCTVHLINEECLGKKLMSDSGQIYYQSQGFHSLVSWVFIWIKG